MDLEDVCRTVELPSPLEEWCVNYKKMKSFRQTESTKRDNRKFYNSYYPSINEIKKRYIPYFHGEITVTYYSILPNGTRFGTWHTDKVKGKKRYNFIWDQGGDNVITRWADNELVVTNPDAPGINIVSTEIQTKIWYELDIATYHKVDNVSSPRLGLSILGNIIDKRLEKINAY